MKNTWKWIVGVVLVLVVLFALPFLFGSLFGYGPGGMMGRYGGWGHMGNGYTPFGGLFMGFGMLLMWAIPLGLLFVVIYGAVRLANQSKTPVTAQSCNNCSKAVQADWNTCPYCGTTL